MLDHKSCCITRRFPALPTLGVNVPETRIFHWPGCENGEKR
jgi:hypothetical protein